MLRGEKERQSVRKKYCEEKKEERTPWGVEGFPEALASPSLCYLRSKNKKLKMNAVSLVDSDLKWKKKMKYGPHTGFSI